jgi:hypothetical protein
MPRGRKEPALPIVYTHALRVDRVNGLGPPSRIPKARLATLDATLATVLKRHPKSDMNGAHYREVEPHSHSLLPWNGAESENYSSFIRAQSGREVRASAEQESRARKVNRSNKFGKKPKTFDQGVLAEPISAMHRMQLGKAKSLSVLDGKSIRALDAVDNKVADAMANLKKQMSGCEEGCRCSACIHGRSMFPKRPADKMRHYNSVKDEGCQTEEVFEVKKEKKEKKGLKGFLNKMKSQKRDKSDLRKLINSAVRIEVLKEKLDIKTEQVTELQGKVTDLLEDTSSLLEDHHHLKRQHTKANIASKMMKDDLTQTLRQKEEIAQILESLKSKDTLDEDNERYHDELGSMMESMMTRIDDAEGNGMPLPSEVTRIIEEVRIENGMTSNQHTFEQICGSMAGAIDGMIKSSTSTTQTLAKAMVRELSGVALSSRSVGKGMKRRLSTDLMNFAVTTGKNSLLSKQVTIEAHTKEFVEMSTQTEGGAHGNLDAKGIKKKLKRGPSRKAGYRRRPSMMPVQTCLAMLFDIFQKKMIKDRFDDARRVPRTTMSAYLDTYLLATFGVKSLADTKKAKMRATIHSYHERNSRVRLMGVVLGFIDHEYFSPKLCDIVLDAIGRIIPKFGAVKEVFMNHEIGTLLTPTFTALYAISGSPKTTSKPSDWYGELSRLCRNDILQAALANLVATAVEPSQEQQLEFKIMQTDTVVDVDVLLTMVCKLYHQEAAEQKLGLLKMIQSFDTDKDEEIGIDEFTSFMHFLEPHRFAHAGSSVELSAMFYDLLMNYADNEELSEIHVVDYCIHAGLYLPHDDRSSAVDPEGKNRTTLIAEIVHMRGLFGEQIEAGKYRDAQKLAPVWADLVAHEPGTHSSFQEVHIIHDKMHKCMLSFLVKVLDKDGDGSLSAEELSHLTA